VQAPLSSLLGEGEKGIELAGLNRTIGSLLPASGKRSSEKKAEQPSLQKRFGKAIKCACSKFPALLGKKLDTERDIYIKERREVGSLDIAHPNLL